MAAPENKENIESQLAKPVQMPRPDQSAIMSAEGPALPARPVEVAPDKPKDIGQHTKQEAVVAPHVEHRAVPKAELPVEKVNNLTQQPKTEAVQARPIEKHATEKSEVVPAKANNLTQKPREELQTPQVEQRRLENPKESPEQSKIKNELLKLKIQEFEGIISRSEQEKKQSLASVLLGPNPNKEILKLADSLIHLSGNAVLINEVAAGTISQAELAKHLLTYIQAQRTFDCSARELAMLDSLEFQLIRALQQINPNIRIQQQQQVQDDMGPDDDAGAGGPEKVEDEREAGTGISEDPDADTDTSYSPRSKKGKARARNRGRDRRSRFKKWLAMMMRIFRGQSLVMRSAGMTRTSARTKARDMRFVKTVRIFGKVIDTENESGIEGVKIISNTLGSVITEADGTFAFENIAVGTSYSLAPFKPGFIFSPMSVNDVGLDDREHYFAMIPE